ncbi:MAG: 7-cyano-7-deazaguanine synthase QueC [Candidatus Omnitrophica bacterium 4484_171]|nr:MAG: 7-cyano-7-deazaguanine synthase QueC [Candidatus Omnitrophica bacterium 4484_171]
MNKKREVFKIRGRSKSAKKAVILLSGGLDSAVTLYLAKKYGYNLYALIFNYKQRHSKEIRFAVKIAGINRIPYYVLNAALPWTQSALTKDSIKVPFNRNLSRGGIPVTYVAGRNIIFLSYAASFAESIGAKKIFIGAHIEDYSGYPDCRPQFLSAMEEAVNKGTACRGIEIAAPLIDKSKRDIIKLGVELSVPFEYTWSCYAGGKHPCGKCDSCRFRIRAFNSLGMADPLLKKPGSKNK